jgi:hypothetical protein
MALLERWNPSGDLERFRHDVDDLLEKFGLERGSFLKDWESFSTLRPAIESYVEGDSSPSAWICRGSTRSRLTSRLPAES